MEHVLHGEEFTGEFPKHSPGWLLHQKLNSFPGNKVLLVELETGQEYTTAYLTETAERVAGNLRDLGISPSETLALICPNNHKFWTVSLACLFSGNPLHLINPNYTKYELERILRISKPSVVFACSRSVGAVMSLRHKSNIKIVVGLDEADNTVSYNDEMCRKCTKPFRCFDEYDLNKVAFVFNSSGTTGFPKGVMATHTNLHVNLIYPENPKVARVNSDSSTVMVMPSYHVYGFNITLAFMHKGGKVVMMDQFKPEPFLRAMSTYKVDRLFLVPALVNFLAKLDNCQNLSTLKEIYSAAGGISREINETVCQKLNLKVIRQIYSLTEMISMTCVTPEDGAPEGSVGKLTPGHDMKFMANGQSQPAGERGEILIRGYTMLGYMGDEESTNNTLDKEGYIHTGDMGYYDDQGFVYIVDRVKDLIKYKSYQVAPAEIEELLMHLGNVVDVAVIGKPDERFGELPVAFVVKSGELDEETVKKHVETHLSNEKWIRGGVRFVDSIPRNAVGKILRKDLREML